MSLSVTIYVN